MKWLGLLLIINLCGAADGMNVKRAVLAAALQVLLDPDSSEQVDLQVHNIPTCIELEQAVFPKMPKPIKHEPSKHKVNKMPDIKCKAHHQHQPGGKH